MPRKSDSHRETEVKLVVKDVAAMVEKLRSAGLKPLGRALEQNSVFDTDDEDLRHRGRLLRLRTETPAPASFAPGGAKRMVLTAKSPAPERPKTKSEGPYKENIEREVILRAPSRRGGRKRTLLDRGWPFALGCIGMRSKFRYEKYRTSFHARGVDVALDETPVGAFLELEGSPEAIDRVAGELGFTARDYIRATYYELYAAERRRKGRAVRHMLFSR